MERRISLFLLSLSFVVGGVLGDRAPGSPRANAQSKSFAQDLVEITVANHPELVGLELATTPKKGQDCITIAATDIEEIGEKCDRGDLDVMRTGISTIEKEADGYDVTAPLKVGEKIIGIIGMDFKLDQKESSLLDQAAVIAREIEGRISSKSKLFQLANK